MMGTKDFYKEWENKTINNKLELTSLSSGALNFILSDKFSSDKSLKFYHSSFKSSLLKLRRAAQDELAERSLLK